MVIDLHEIYSHWCLIFLLKISPDILGPTMSVTSSLFQAKKILLPWPFFKWLDLPSLLTLDHNSRVWVCLCSSFNSTQVMLQSSMTRAEYIFYTMTALSTFSLLVPETVTFLPGIQHRWLGWTRKTLNICFSFSATLLFSSGNNSLPLPILKNNVLVGLPTLGPCTPNHRFRPLTSTQPIKESFPWSQ